LPAKRAPRQAGDRVQAGPFQRCSGNGDHHTGALAGEDDIADAFLKDLGIVRVDMLETLFEVFPWHRKVPLQSHSMAGTHRRGDHHRWRCRHGGGPAGAARHHGAACVG
jgi:hypothetical protein